MVDNVLEVQKFGVKSSCINQVINTFMESEKVSLPELKCHNIHIGKNKQTCKDLIVHGHKRHQSRKNKYLGRMIDKTGNQRSTIQDRKCKGYGIVSHAPNEKCLACEFNVI